MADIIQLRRDTRANWASANPVLAAGEPGIETDTRKVKYGDGVTAWNSLGYSSSSGGSYDISDANNGATYANLAAALAVVPSSEQKGGMSVKYIDSTTSKYVEYRLTSNTWNTTVGNWVSKQFEDFILNGIGQETKRTMSQKAITDLYQEFDEYANGVDKTVDELEGEIEHYQSAGLGYTNYGVMQHSASLSLSFNRVKIGPIKASSGTPTAKYYIKRGAWGDRTTPANLTTVKSGTIKLSITFQQYEVELSDVVTLSDEYLYVYVICGTTIAFLGNDGSNSPSQYNGSYNVFYSNNGSNVNVTWSYATGNRWAVRPILRLVLEPAANQAIENVITTSPTVRGKAAQSDLNALEDEFDEFTTDTDITIKEDGEIEFYEQYNYGYGNASVAQYTKTKTEAYKATSVVVGPVKGVGVSEATYYVVVVADSRKTNITNGTTIKTGTLSIGTTFAQHTIDFGEEVTIPVGSVLAVYFIRKTGGGTIVILGNNNTAGATRNGTPIVMYGGNATANWTYGNSGYVAVQPILKYHKDSGCKALVNDEIDNAMPSIISALQDEIGNQVEAKMPEIIEDVEESIGEVEVQLPSKIVAVVGDTLQVFYRSIVKAVDPYAYDVVARCSKGGAFRRYFEYKPVAGDVGSTTLTINVYDRKGLKVGTASTTLVTVAAPISPSNQINVFCFGDSLTSGGEWPCEVKRRLVNSNSVDSIVGKELSNIAFCGSLEKTANSTTVKYYGKGGWDWVNYTSANITMYRVYVTGVTAASIDATYTNNNKTFTIKEINITNGEGSLLLSGSGVPTNGGTLTKASGNGDAEIMFSSYELDNANPLWDTPNNVMSFVPYVENYGDGQIDVVYVLLSWNGKSAWTEYTTDNVSYIRTFLRKLHTEYPDAKAKILGLQMPSNQSGLGQNYGASGGYPDRYGLYNTAWSYNKALEDICNLTEFAPYCEYVDVASQFDSEYNMKGGNSKVNTRNSSKTTYEHTNGVHPDVPGYYQIADVVYRNFVKEFCQGE